jgi:hypothetical protein
MRTRRGRGQCLSGAERERGESLPALPPRLCAPRLLLGVRGAAGRVQKMLHGSESNNMRPPAAFAVSAFPHWCVASPVYGCDWQVCICGDFAALSARA